VRPSVLVSSALALLVAGCASQVARRSEPSRPQLQSLPQSIAIDGGEEADGAPYFTVGEPTSSLAPDGGPRGLMLVIHGGGWQSRGERSVDEPRNRAEADRWRARGWRTIAISFRSSSEGPPEVWPFYPIGQVLPTVPGSARRSIDDVVWFHDRIREWQGSALPMCATGWSSGGHLALLLAAERPDLDCVVALAAPTDLPALFAAWTDGGRAAAFAFGAQAASTSGNGLSPVDVAGQIRARLLLATAANDSWVPPSQMDALRAALERSGSPAPIETLELEPGRQLFWHGHVSPRALAELQAAEDKLAREVGR